MGKEKKSILSKLFKGSSSCDCGIEIVEDENKKASSDGKDSKKSKE
tara:strand:+ start:76 stop:213 length:138 start_codon:yes stop_codon:yes gene_type:complete